MREILQRADVQEEVAIRSSLGFMAYHGGTLEKATDVIAREAAEISGSSYYGLIQSNEDPIHFPSTSLLSNKSEGLDTFLNHVQIVITIHGYGREHLFHSVLLGGQNRALALHMASFLRIALPEYSFETSLEEIPKELRGLHPNNPVNIPPMAGVQVEIPPTLRWNREEWGWSDNGGIGRAEQVNTLIESLSQAVMVWPFPLS
ncbi:MAG: poly-gamma-glutamate hydrolase family protein [Actinomycetota bacterium]|nr:poly-gamma-glutamate hydrolase family protein [Actinomycetota bacterium]